MRVVGVNCINLRKLVNSMVSEQGTTYQRDEIPRNSMVIRIQSLDDCDEII